MEQYYDERLQKLMRKLKDDLKTSTEAADQSRALSQGLPTYFPASFDLVRVTTLDFGRRNLLQILSRVWPNSAVDVRSALCIA